jgi:hypothetical protein
MKQEPSSIVYDGIVVPESALLRIERSGGCGTVDGLEEDELADPEELERQVFLQEFGPVLALPRDRRTGWLPVVDSADGMDWGAFGSIDFQRIRPPFDKARYKAEKLRQEDLKHAVIMLSIVKEHVPGRAKYLVLKYLRMGWIDLEDIADENMRTVAKWFLRVRDLRKQIEDLEARSRRKQLRCEAEVFPDE